MLSPSEFPTLTSTAVVPTARAIAGLAVPDSTGTPLTLSTAVESEQVGVRLSEDTV